MPTQNLSCHRFLCLASIATVSLVAGVTSARPTYAQFTETESNNTKATANTINLGTATAATISGSSASNASGEFDYYQINTTYQTPGIYRNQLQLSNASSFTASLRGQSQSAGVINSGTDVLFQSSLTSGTAAPYGFNQYYSFGGVGKTQSMYYRVNGSGASTGGSYTATFTSSLITTTSIGSFTTGSINFSSLTNIGSSGVGTNTEITVFDSNFNLYYDNVANSPTFGFAAANDNSAAPFRLTRSFGAGTYYIAIGINNLATNDAAPSDDTTAARNGTVLDFDNVIATTNTFYDGNNGNTRPSDFSVTDSNGNPFTSSGQVIPSLYGLNFYSFTVAPAVTVVPEANTILLTLIALGTTAIYSISKRRATISSPCPK